MCFKLGNSIFSAICIFLNGKSLFFSFLKKYLKFILKQSKYFSKHRTKLSTPLTHVRRHRLLPLTFKEIFTLSVPQYHLNKSVGSLKRKMNLYFQNSKKYIIFLFHCSKRILFFLDPNLVCHILYIILGKID